MCNNKSISEVNVAELVNIQTGMKIDMVKLNSLPDNAMLKVRPELWCEWDFEKNDVLGYDIWKMTKGTHKKVWWICKRCGSKYDTRIVDKVRTTKCPYCAGHKLNYTNSLSNLNSQLASEWHPTLNGNLTPFDVTCNSNKKVWWLGECGHEWEAIVYNRHKVNGTNCPICVNRKVLIGFNDLSTSHPHIAESLLNKEDGLKYTYGSPQKVDWKCLNCGNIINKSISEVTSGGLNCPSCSDGISLAEKIVFNILKTKNIAFIKEKIFTWSDKKRYDFYLVEYNIIIETHGEQHKNGSFKPYGGRTLEEEVANDQYKFDLATNNGIFNYIVIDASDVSLNTFKQEVLKSELKNIIDFSDINWENIYKTSSKSILIEVCNEWNNGEHSYEILSKKYGIAKGTVRDYLKRGTEMNICTYTVEDAIANSSLNQKRKIVQLTPSLEYIVTWESLSQAVKENNFKGNNGILDCCIGINKIFKDYKWMYEEDYQYYLLTGEIRVTRRKNKANKNARKVVKLDLNLNYLGEYESILDAAIENNIKSYSYIRLVCKGKRKSCRGFKWMYKEDYEKQFNKKVI